jgi:hypothetical protein
MVEGFTKNRPLKVFLILKIIMLNKRVFNRYSLQILKLPGVSSVTFDEQNILVDCSDENTKSQIPGIVDGIKIIFFERTEKKETQLLLF